MNFLVTQLSFSKRETSLDRLEISSLGFHQPLARASRGRQALDLPTINTQRLLPAENTGASALKISTSSGITTLASSALALTTLTLRPCMCLLSRARSRSQPQKRRTSRQRRSTRKKRRRMILIQMKMMMMMTHQTTNLLTLLLRRKRRNQRRKRRASKRMDFNQCRNLLESLKVSNSSSN